MFGIISIGNNIFLNGGGLCYVSGYYQGIYGRYLRPIITIKSNMLNNECEKDENGVWQLHINWKNLKLRKYKAWLIEKKML